MTDDAPTEAEIVELERLMTLPDYDPILASATVIALMFHVSRQAVTNWGARTDRTGVHRYPVGYDVNEVAVWLFRRDQKQAARRSRHAENSPDADACSA